MMYAVANWLRAAKGCTPLGASAAVSGSIPQLRLASRCAIELRSMQVVQVRD